MQLLHRSNRYSIIIIVARTLDAVVKIREIADPDNSCKYIIWNNKEILIDAKSDFLNTLLSKFSIQSTGYLTQSFNIVNQKGKVSIFLIWTELRKSVPLHLREKKSNTKMIYDLKNYRCRHY